MLRAPIIHPDVLRALAAAGHKSLVVVTDAHYAAETTRGRNATVVHGALAPGSPTVTEVVSLIAATLAIEAMTSMTVPDASLGGVVAEVAAALGDPPHDWVERAEFYALSRSDDVVLCVTTGDTRRFANVILRVGVTEPGAD